MSVVEQASSPRQHRRDARQAEIVAAAWELAHRDGLAALSLRDLADKVGLRQPSLYAYFDAKSGLYDLMFADGNRSLLEAAAALTPTGDAKRDLVAFVEMTVRFCGADPVRYQLLFQRTIPGFEPSAESYALAEKFLEHSKRLIKATGVSASGSIDLFTAIVAGLADQQVANDPGGERWVRMSARAVDMFLTDAQVHSRPARRGRS